MTENKRFTLREPKVYDNIGCSEIADNGEWISYGEIVDLLNQLNEENEQLKRRIGELELINDGLNYALKNIKGIEVEIDLSEYKKLVKNGEI